MRMRTVNAMSAGQIDAALSSVATFIAGLYAVRVFETSLLGAYVVVFTAWNLARSLSSELVFVPSEVVAVGRPDRERIEVLDSSVPRGVLISLLGAAGVFGSMFIIRGGTETGDALALALTAAAVTVVAPLQEHWRRMFHITANSWRAAAVSTLHLAATTVGVLWAGRLVNPAWVPLGALASGFVVSSALAWTLTRHLREPGAGKANRPSWQELTGIGRWLLVANASAMGSDFLLAVIVNASIGAEMLGYAEGARVVARPVVILGLGLAAVLGPRSVSAGLDRELGRARWTRRTFWLVSTFVGLTYLAIVGHDWALNPLPEIVPTAYAIDGLVAIAVSGSIIFNFGFPWWFEMLGGRRQRQIAWSETTAGVLKVAIGLLAPILRAFTLPIAWVTAWTVRGMGLKISSDRLFRTPPGSDEDSALPAVYD